MSDSDRESLKLKKKDLANKEAEKGKKKDVEKEATTELQSCSKMASKFIEGPQPEEEY